MGLLDYLHRNVILGVHDLAEIYLLILYCDIGKHQQSAILGHDTSLASMRDPYAAITDVPHEHRCEFLMIGINWAIGIVVAREIVSLVGQNVCVNIADECWQTHTSSAIGIVVLV